MPNYYNTSSGERVSEATIKQRRSRAYRQLYEGETHPMCGCGKRAEGTLHLYPQALCKSSGQTEYIWNPINLRPACHSCNSRCENVDAVAPEDWFYEDLLRVTEMLDQSRYQKILLNGNNF
jgi:hypothetical protein